MNYKIGEFSRITLLPIKTLRYYQDVGILMPMHIDEANGYRYYSNTEYELAQLIKLLRSFEFSINEIKEILENYEDDDDIKIYLLEKNEMIQKKINEYKRIQEKIKNYKSHKEVLIMTTQNINKIEIEDILIASITYTGKYEDCGKYIGKLMKAVGGQFKGKPFSIYHDDEFKEDEALIEVCIGIKKNITNNSVICKTLKGGNALALMHLGSYDTISHSYKALTDYMKSNNIEPIQHVREFYIKGPGMLLKGNPEKYKTEILYII